MNAMGGATAVTPRRIKLRGGLFPPTMTETELLSTLVGEIYDAALDATLWRPTLAKAARFVGGYAASLFTKSASSLTGTNVYDSGIEARVADSYFTNYIKLDPLVMGHVFAEIGRPTAVSDLMPYGEFVQSRFYEEWAKPQTTCSQSRRTASLPSTFAQQIGQSNNALRNCESRETLSK